MAFFPSVPDADMKDTPRPADNRRIPFSQLRRPSPAKGDAALHRRGTGVDRGVCLGPQRL